MSNKNKLNQKQNQKVIVHIHDKPRRKTTKSKPRRTQDVKLLQPIYQSVVPIASGLAPQGYGQFTNNQTPLPNLPPHPMSSTVDLHHRNITDVPNPFDVHHRNITGIEATNRAAQAISTNKLIEML